MTYDVNLKPPIALADAIAMLSSQIGRDVSRDTFFQSVVEHSLPLYAATPPDARCAYLAATVNARLAAEDFNGYPRPLAVLMPPDIRDLWVHGSATTKRIAVYPGQPDFMTWEAIKARRDELRQLDMAGPAGAPQSNVAGQKPEKVLVPMWLPEDDELMGQSDVVCFWDPILVTDQNCRVPPHTLSELLQNLTVSAIGRVAQEAPVSHRTMSHKLSRDLLDRPIEQAVQRAGATGTADVYTILREMALEGDAPFNGQVDADGLWYTDHDNEVKLFKREALRSRLRRRK